MTANLTFQPSLKTEKGDGGWGGGVWRQTDRHRDRDREANRQAGRQAGRQVGRQVGRLAERDRQTNTERHRRHTDRQT